MKFRSLTVVVAATIFMATPAWGASRPQQELHRQQARYYHAVGYLAAIRHTSYRTFLSIQPIKRLQWSAKVNTLIRVRDDARMKIERLRVVIQRAAQLAARPAHYAGWLCIHGGEGSWSDGGWPYYGGLQMHEWWGGVQYANTLSPMKQMWLAETHADMRSYSYMHGQWPNSFPPCAHYFGF